MEDVTFFSFPVGTIIAPARVRIGSELIIAAGAAVGKMHSKVGGRFEIVENQFGAGEMAGERLGIVSATYCNCE
jgi:hypothetical protein